MADAIAAILEVLIEALGDVIVSIMTLFPWWVNTGIVASIVGFFGWYLTK